ncbi:MAG: 3-methyl-2-oxobutanoate hydroxymethyltransferase [Xanthomonadales bacterium]|nr:3-methyl-2-oxobutanoate hydroxymethyltransferase [Xanthomonadales bacterium]
MAGKGNLTISDLTVMKQQGEKIAMLTGYDATFAAVMDKAGVDIILVGDSLGNVVQGRETTVAVSVEDMVYHTRAVARGIRRTFLLSDMPYGSYHNSETAMANAHRLMAAGGHMVKLEGAGPYIEVVEYLSSRGVPVCGHLGLTPQSVHQLGGFKVQAREEAAAEQLRQDARALQQAGARMLVLEAIPAPLAAEVSGELDIVVIGIGAGPECDGQVLVMHDMLGLSDRLPKFVRNFMDGQSSIEAAFKRYVADVRSGAFPAEAHQY